MIPVPFNTLDTVLRVSAEPIKPGDYVVRLEIWEKQSDRIKKRSQSVGVLSNPLPSLEGRSLRREELLSGLFLDQPPQLERDSIAVQPRNRKVIVWARTSNVCDKPGCPRRAPVVPEPKLDGSEIIGTLFDIGNVETRHEVRDVSNADFSVAFHELADLTQLSAIKHRQIRPTVGPVKGQTNGLSFLFHGVPFVSSNAKVAPRKRHSVRREALTLSTSTCQERTARPRPGKAALSHCLPGGIS